jgi:hypothetical protein
VRAERSSRIRDVLGVRVQVTLGGNQRSVPGDLPEDVDRNADVGHPGQAGVAQVVAAQMLVAQVGDDLVPVRRVAEHGRGDSTAARPGEDPRRWVIVNSMEALFDQWTGLFNERDGAGPLAFSAFVDDPTWAGCGLPPDRPGPGVAVNVGAPDAGHFADPSRSASGEDNNVAPAFEVIGRPGDERRSQVAERLPIWQRQ